MQRTRLRCTAIRKRRRGDGFCVASQHSDASCENNRVHYRR